MLRKFVIFGACAMVSAYVPVAYEADPDKYIGMVENWFAEEPATDQVSELPTVTKSVNALQIAGRKVRIQSDGRGHFTTDFKLNGQRVTAMVDTGATLVAINATTARKIGLKLAPGDFRYEVDTANGTVYAAGAVLDDIQVGKIFVKNVQALVLQDDALKGTLVGMSFLRQLKKYQVEDGALVLEQ